MDEVLSSQPGLTNQPINHPDVEYCSDGSSFVQDGTHFARNSVVTLKAVTETLQLPVGTSNSGEKVLNMNKKILKLLEAVWAPK
jgi:hypothetical protein